MMTVGLSLLSHSVGFISNGVRTTKKDCPCGQSLVVPWGILFAGELDEQRG